MKTNGIIYKITNKINGKVYIGKTVQEFKSRVKAHKYKSCTAFNRAIEKYGWDNFEKEEFISALNEDYLAELEEKTIKYFNSLTSGNGYNLIEIDNGLNRFPQETKDKISQKQKAHHASLTEKPKAVNKKEHIFIDNIEHKHCPKCNTNKILANFNKDKKRWDGHCVFCRECHNVNYNRGRYKPLSEEAFQQSYVDRKEAVSAGVKKSFQDNPELRAKKAQEKSKAIIGTHIETGKEIEFPSALEANKYGFSNVRINVAIKKGYVHKNHTWRFK